MVYSTDGSSKGTEHFLRPLQKLWEAFYMSICVSLTVFDSESVSCKAVSKTFGRLQTFAFAAPLIQCSSLQHSVGFTLMSFESELSELASLSCI